MFNMTMRAGTESASAANASTAPKTAAANARGRVLIEFKYFLRRTVQAGRRALRFDQVDVGIMDEHPFVQNPRMTDDGHVLRDQHILVTANERPLHHVVAHPVHAQ